MFEVEDVPKPDVPKVYLQVHRHEETQPRLSDLCGASRKRETKAPSPLLSVAAGTMNSKLALPAPSRWLLPARPQGSLAGKILGRKAGHYNEITARYPVFFNRM